MALYVAIVVLYVIVWYGWAGLFPDEKRPYHLYLPLVYLGWLLQHELGHLAAARMVGMRFEKIMILGITVSRSKGGWRLDVGEFQQGGHAGAIPVGLHRLKARQMIFTLGGPIADGVGIAVAASLLLVWPYSPVLIMWIVLSALGLYWSFRKGQENDLWHLRQSQGIGEGANGYLASYVMAAEGVDEAERERHMAELGFPGAIRAYRITELIDAERYDEARSALAQTIESGEVANPEHLVWYECNAAFYFALRGFDVERAVAYLPPETRAQAYEHEHTWLYAAFLIAALQGRWEEAEEYARRGVEHPEGDDESFRWFEMARRSAARRLEFTKLKAHSMPQGKKV